MSSKRKHETIIEKPNVEIQRSTHSSQLNVSGKTSPIGSNNSKNRRVFNETDEISFLNGLLDYSSQKGSDPALDSYKEFYVFVKPYLAANPSKTQVIDKVRSLKRKYFTAISKKDFHISSLINPHDQTLFQLFQKLWGQNTCTEPDVGNNRNSSAEQFLNDHSAVLTEPNVNLGDCTPAKKDVDVGHRNVSREKNMSLDHHAVHAEKDVNLGHSPDSSERYLSIGAFPWFSASLMLIMGVASGSEVEKLCLNGLKSMNSDKQVEVEEQSKNLVSSTLKAKSQLFKDQYMHTQLVITAMGLATDT